MDTEPARIRRGAPRGRGRRGRGGGRRYSDKYQPSLSTNADRYAESGDEEDDPNIPVSKSEGQDLESLLQNLHLTEWGAYSHHRILVNELNREPPLATDGSHPKELALDMSELALSLATLPLHEVLDIDPKYFQETEMDTGKTKSGRVSCRLILEDPAAAATKEVENREKDAVEVVTDLDVGSVSGDAKTGVVSDPCDIVDDANHLIEDVRDGETNSNCDEIAAAAAADDDDSDLSDDFDLFLDDVPSSQPASKRPIQSSAPTSSQNPSTEHRTNMNGKGVCEISQRASLATEIKDGEKTELNRVVRDKQSAVAGDKDLLDEFDDGASSDDLDALLDMSRGGKQTNKGGASLESWMDSL